MYCNGPGGRDKTRTSSVTGQRIVSKSWELRPPVKSMNTPKITRIFLKSVFSDLVNSFRGSTPYLRQRMWAIKSVKYAIRTVMTVRTIATIHKKIVIYFLLGFVPLDERGVGFVNSCIGRWSLAV